MHPLTKDITGLKVGYLTVLEYSGQHKLGGAVWRCLCDGCGDEYDIRAGAISLARKMGTDISCGCKRRETQRTKNTHHGKTHHPLYKVWSNMKARCGNPNEMSYVNYGGRGISVCERWMSFQAFYDDVHKDWRPGLQMDRIDNDGNYCPENVRFVTAKENAKNRRSNRPYDLAATAEKLGVKLGSLENRWWRKQAMLGPCVPDPERTTWVSAVKKG